MVVASDKPKAMNGRKDSTPTPDPTVLTTEQLFRESQSLKDLIGARMDGIEKEYKAASVANSDSIDHLKELTQTQLKERDTRVEQVKEDGEKAIAAALQAQKEAVGKTELGFTKELDAVKGNMETLAAGLRAQLDDVKVLVSSTIPRTEVGTAITALSDRLATLEKMQASQQGSLLMASFFASAIPTVVAVLLFFLHK